MRSSSGQGDPCGDESLEPVHGRDPLYGGDFFAAPRSEFDPNTFEERPYDVEKVQRLFREANERLHASRGT